MQCVPLFGVETHTKLIETQFYKIDQNELRCVKSGHKETKLATTGRTVSLWTISSQ